MMQATYYRNALLELIHFKNKPMTYRAHNHVATYTIGFIVAGAVSLITDTNTTYFKNSFFIVAPYQVHGLHLGTQYELVTLSLHQTLLQQYSAAQACAMVTAHLQSLSIAFPLGLLPAAITQLYQQRPVFIENQWISKSADTLRLHPERPINTQALATGALCSKFHYIKLFKNHIGITPHQFQLQNKVRKAQRLLEQNIPSSVVATNLGFCDQSHFIKCFKDAVGFTPSSYKQIAKAIPDCAKRAVLNIL